MLTTAKAWKKTKDLTNRISLPGSKCRFRKRVAILQRFSGLLADRSKRWPPYSVPEAGKRSPAAVARNEVRGAIALHRLADGPCRKYLADEIMKTDTRLEERIAYEPAGCDRQYLRLELSISSVGMCVCTGAARR